MIDQVHAGIDIAVFQSRVGRNVCAPLFGIVADEVTDLARQLLSSGHLRLRIRPDMLNAESGRRSQRVLRGPPKSQRRLGRSQKQIVTGAAREKLDATVRLTAVDFKAQRQLAVVHLGYARC